MAHIKLKKIKVSKPDKDMPMSHHDSYPPSFVITAEQVPEIKNWELGGKYKMIIEVEMRGLNKDEDATIGNFYITAYKYIPEKAVEDMSDEEFSEYQNEVLGEKT